MQKKKKRTYSKSTGECDEQHPMSMYWMTEEIIDETIQVWSGMYGRTISRNEAIEILRNMANFYELVRAKTGSE